MQSGRDLEDSCRQAGPAVGRWQGGRSRVGREGCLGPGAPSGRASPPGFHRPPGGEPGVQPSPPVVVSEVQGKLRRGHEGGLFTALSWPPGAWWEDPRTPGGQSLLLVVPCPETGGLTSGLGGPGPACHFALGLTRAARPAASCRTHPPGPSLVPIDWSRCFQSPQPRRVCVERVSTQLIEQLIIHSNSEACLLNLSHLGEQSARSCVTRCCPASRPLPGAPGLERGGQAPGPLGASHWRPPDVWAPSSPPPDPPTLDCAPLQSPPTTRCLLPGGCGVCAPWGLQGAPPRTRHLVLG